MLSIPLASFVKFLSEKKWYYNILFYCVAMFFVWLNIFQTYQFEFHALHYDGMTKRLYFKQFGKMDSIPDSEPLISWPNYDEAFKGNSCETSRSVPDQVSVLNNNFGDRKELARKTIQLKAANGKYVCADGSLNNIVIADRDTALGWETFTLILFENNECAILAYNNKFFCAESSNHNEIRATRDNVAKRETFLLRQLDSNHVAFNTQNEKFMSLDAKTLRLIAKGDAVGENEKFMITIK